MTPAKNPEELYSRSTKPWFLTAFQVELLVISMYQVYSFVQVVLKYKILNNLRMQVPPLFLGFTGMVWGGLGFTLYWAIYTQKSWSAAVGTLLSCLYTIYFWLDQSLLSQLFTLQRRWPINLIYTILGLGGALIILNHKTSRGYFRNAVKIT